MKRALGLLIAIAAIAVGFLTVRGTMPFMPVFGVSMQPVLHAGDLITIEPIANPYDIKAGDIIVFNVAPLIREHYNYPPVVAHRVKDIYNTDGQLTFRTKGDNTGEDPFAVRPEDLRGTVGEQIPYLGFPLLFLQSQYGTIFVIIALSLLALFLYSEELDLGRKKLQRGIFSPIIQESGRTTQVLAQKMEATEQRMDSTQQALEKFASAIELYAQHLASHTSAIQGLAEASHELKRSAAEQNRVLVHLMENMGQAKPLQKQPETTPPAPEREEIAPQAKQKTHTPGCIHQRQPASKPVYGHMH